MELFRMMHHEFETIFGAEFIGSDEIMNMRTRALKRFLTKHGINKAEMTKMLDKNELRVLALGIINEINSEKSNQAQIKLAFYVTVLLGVLLVVYLLKDVLFSVLQGIVSWCMGEIFQLKLKSKMIKLAMKNSRYSAIMYIILAIIINVIQTGIKTSIFASWVLPSGNFMRRYFIPTFSLPLSTENIFGRGAPAFGVDMGPMLTLYALGWLQNKLENLMAFELIDIVDAKNIKKRNKNENYSTSNYEEDWARGSTDCRSAEAQWKYDASSDLHCRTEEAQWKYDASADLQFVDPHAQSSS